MQANEYPDLLCTPLPAVVILQESLLSRVQVGYDAAIAWVFLPLVNEQSADRVPLVCWVGLNLQLFSDQVFF